MAKREEQEELILNFKAAIFDELTPIYPDTDLAEGFGEYTVAGCNGTVVGVHFMLQGLVPGIPVTVEVKGSHRSFKLFELKTVPVEVNCGAKLRTEYLKDDFNEFVIRRAPFTIYEVYEPFYNIFTPAFAHTALAFKTPVEYCRETRERVWEIIIRQGEAEQTLTLRVKEFPSVVPKAGEHTFGYVNWLDFDHMAEDYHCEKWSEKYFGILEQYLRAAVFSRQNTLCIRLPEIFTQNSQGLPVLNEARLDRIIHTAQRAGIALFHGSAFADRMPYMSAEETYASLDHDAISDPEEIGRAYRIQAFEVFDHCPMARLGITGQELPGEAGEETLRIMAEQLYGYLKQRGLTERWYQNCLDEPNEALTPVYRRICQIVKSAMPKIPILEPNLDHQGLEGTMDIWCPSLDKYEQNQEFYKSRAALGERFWVYTCLTPAGNYCNRLLDMERLRAVWIGWAPILYPDIEGYLHWGGNYNTSGDLCKRQAVTFGEDVLEFYPKHAMFLPAGDSAIFFPGIRGPLICTRSEAHRIGFEDLHLLHLLQEKSPEKVLPLVREVFRACNDYEKDVCKYREVRLRLLELLHADEA